MPCCKTRKSPSAIRGCSTARIEKDQRNQPRPWAGAFAVVYKAFSPDDQRPFAVRVFTSESPERRERYELVAAYVKDHKPRCLVEFEYRDQSIRSAGDGKWYPVILMEWVQGETLFNWVRDRCREGNAEAVGFLADRWLDAVKELADAGIAHGDLQHGNVMVTPQNEIKLVDYDCMCVPALVGRRNLEVGVEPYQHPDRNAKTLLSLDLDHFSALLIYVALRALAANPQFWSRYVERAGYDKLLFRREDLQSPITSPLYRDLMRLANRGREGVDRAACGVEPPADGPGSAAGATGPFLCQGRAAAVGRGNGTRAVHLLNRRGNFRDAPEHLQPLIREAYEFVCRQEAWAAFARIPHEASEAVDRRLVEAWNEALFADYPPAEQERPRVAEARRRVQIVDRLRHLAQQAHPSARAGRGAAPAGGGGAIARRLSPQPPRAGGAGRQMLGGHGAAGSRRRGAGPAKRPSWRRGGRFRRPIASTSSAASGTTASPWPSSEFPCLKLLAELPEGLPLDQCDAQLLAVWQDELLAGCAEAEPWRFPLRSGAGAEGGARAPADGGRGAGRGGHRRVDAAAVSGRLSACRRPGRSRSARARARARRTEAMLAALEKGQPAAFYEVFDVRLVRRSPERFAPHQALLAEWIRAAVLPPEKLGLQAAADGENLAAVREPEGDWRVQWTWPAAAAGRPLRAGHLPGRAHRGRRSADGGRPPPPVQSSGRSGTAAAAPAWSAAKKPGKGPGWRCGRSSMRDSRLCQPAAGLGPFGAPLALEMEGTEEEMRD